MSQIYLIGGPNGAGKTTSALSLLNQELAGLVFINADVIAAQLNPTSPETAAFQAARIMIEQLEEAMTTGIDFVFESTLATRSFVPFLRCCQEKGYLVNLLFFWLDSPELAIRRVAARVQTGGHNVPEEDIRRRYQRGLINLQTLYIPLANRWTVFDNSLGEIKVVAEQEPMRGLIVYDEITWQEIVRSGNASSS
jgi:predicted ABC-type ATPase